jgi:hypothetical protein
MKTQRKYNTFGRGGAFTCHCCKRRTREVSSDHAQLELCEPCFELAGIDNAFNDYGSDEAFQQYGSEARQWLSKLQKLGGDLKNWAHLIAKLDAAERPGGLDDARVVAPEGKQCPARTDGGPCTPFRTGGKRCEYCAGHC